MLTLKQKKWISHLSKTDKIVIKPYDKSAPNKFKKVRKFIQERLGNKVLLEHHGATMFKISGQNEIDTYLPVEPEDFNGYIEKIKTIFGEPRSLYPMERARFTFVLGRKHVDIFLVNKKDKGWTNLVAFEDCLTKHPKALEEYRILKEKGNGLSVQEYYRRKDIFINRILKLYSPSAVHNFKRHHKERQ